MPIFFIFLFLGFGWWVKSNNFLHSANLPKLSSSNPRSKWNILEKIKTTFTLAVSALISFYRWTPLLDLQLPTQVISFEMFTSAKPTKISNHFWGLIDYSIPILMGSKHFWETDDIFAYSTVVYCVIYALIFAAFLYFYRHELFKNPYILLTSFILCTFSIFVVSSFGHLYQAPRYLLPTYISIFIIIALVINKLNSISPHFANTATVVILCLNLLSAYAGGRAIPGEPIVYNYDRVSKDHSELITWLAEQNITAVKTNYWIGYRLAFETEEKVKFLVFQHPTQTRIKSYKEDILNHYDENKIPLILSPTQIPLIKSALTTLGYQYLEKQIANYTIIYNIEEIHKNLIAIPEADFTLKASSKNENINLVLDKDNKTRWGSGEPQNPNMNIIARI